MYSQTALRFWALSLSLSLSLTHTPLQAHVQSFAKEGMTVLRQS